MQGSVIGKAWHPQFWLRCHRSGGDAAIIKAAVCVVKRRQTRNRLKRNFNKMQSISRWRGTVDSAKEMQTMTKRTMTRVASLTLFVLTSAYALQAADAAEPYASTVRFDDSNRHYIVEITSNSQHLLACHVTYSGRSFIGQDLRGTREVLIRGVGKDNTPVVVSVHFGGFLDFTSSVLCEAK
jgi:uncharacterized protein involved in tolerance to divalent cations